MSKQAYPPPSGNDSLRPRSPSSVFPALPAALFILAAFDPPRRRHPRPQPKFCAVYLVLRVNRAIIVTKRRSYANSSHPPPNRT